MILKGGFGGGKWSHGFSELSDPFIVGIFSPKYIIGTTARASRCYHDR
jgi:hypothetical protein